MYTPAHAEEVHDSLMVVAFSVFRRFEDLSELMAEERNYALYRRRMNEALDNPPCLPFLGVFLTQITQMDAFNKLHGRRPSRRGSRRRSSRRLSSHSVRRRASETTIVDEAQLSAKDSLAGLMEVTEEEQPDRPVVNQSTAGPSPASTDSRDKPDGRPQLVSASDQTASVLPDRPEGVEHRKTSIVKKASVEEDSAYGSDCSHRSSLLRSTSSTPAKSPDLAAPVDEKKEILEGDPTIKTSAGQSPRLNRCRPMSVASGSVPPARSPVIRACTTPNIAPYLERASTLPKPQTSSIDGAPKTKKEPQRQQELNRQHRMSISQRGSNVVTVLSTGVGGQRISMEMSLEDQLEVYRAAAAAYRHCSRPWVKHAIDSVSFNTEEENYKLSLLREPRQIAKTSWRNRFRPH